MMRGLLICLMTGCLFSAIGQDHETEIELIQEKMGDEYVLENHEYVLHLFDSMMIYSVKPDLKSIKQAYLSATKVFDEFNERDSILQFAKKLYPDAFPITWDTLNALPRLIEKVKDSRVTIEDEKFTLVDKQPEFKGGMAKFYKTVSKILQYPSEARRNGTEGRVYVEFIVSESGEITNINALQGIGNGCDEEAVRIMENMPNFIPGSVKGNPVKVKMILPIYFKLAH